MAVLVHVLLQLHCPFHMIKDSLGKAVKQYCAGVLISDKQRLQTHRDHDKHQPYSACDRQGLLQLCCVACLVEACHARLHILRFLAYHMPTAAHVELLLGSSSNQHFTCTAIS
jgi:hypothetical protein